MITLTADKVVIRGPKVDGGYVVSFEVGEFQQQQVMLIGSIPQNTPIDIEIKPHE